MTEPAAVEATLEGARPCRSCDVPIVFRRTPKGRLIPLNPTPDPAGNVEVTGSKAIVHAQPTLDGGVRYMPHHATCPKADEWR